MEFHLRDPNVVQKLIDATKGGNFNPKEHYELVWDGHSPHIYDISSSVHTFHLLSKFCNADTLSHLLQNWSLMANIRLTIYHNKVMVSFLPNGIIFAHSQVEGDRVFHAGNSKDVEMFIKLLQQG